MVWINFYKGAFILVPLPSSEISSFLVLNLTASSAKLTLDSFV